MRLFAILMLSILAGPALAAPQSAPREPEGIRIYSPGQYGVTAETPSRMAASREAMNWGRNEPEAPGRNTAAVRDQADALMLQVIQMLDGDEEAEIVSALLSLRRTLEDQDAGERRTTDVEAAQNRVINLVNTFFRDKLEGVPTIRDYIRAMQEGTA